MGIWGKTRKLVHIILLIIILSRICWAEPGIYTDPPDKLGKDLWINSNSVLSYHRWHRKKLHTYTSNSTSLTFLELKKLAGSNYEAFHFPKLKSISVRKAKILSEWLSCTELSIGPELKFEEKQFELLAKSNVDILEFLFVRRLTDKQAEILSNSKAHTFYLDSLKSISSNQARSLVSKKRGRLSLNGIEVLYEWVANEFAKFDGSISLRGLRLITPEAAIALKSKYGSLLPLLGITELTYKQAVTLSELEVRTLVLSDINQLPHEQLAILSRSHANFLILDLDTLTIRQAKLLSQFGAQNDQIRDWYQKIKEQCSDGCDHREFNARFRCPVVGISLGELEYMSDSVVEILSKARCVSLHLPKLKKLNEFQAECLGNFIGSRVYMPNLDKKSGTLFREYRKKWEESWMTPQVQLKVD